MHLRDKLTRANTAIYTTVMAVIVWTNTDSVMIYSFLSSYLQCLSYLILSLDTWAGPIKCLVVVIHLPFTLHVLSLLSLTRDLYLDPHF